VRHRSAGNASLGRPPSAELAKNIGNVGTPAGIHTVGCSLTKSRCPIILWQIGALVAGMVLLCRLGLAEPVQFNGRIFDLLVPLGMCALSEQLHKSQLDFARQTNPERRFLVLIVPCDRLALYEPDSTASAGTSLLFDTAEWGVLLNGQREIIVSGNAPSLIASIKAGLQQGLEALNSARAKGQRFPATGPELRNLTIIDERADRIFTTSINRFQRPFDRGPVDRYTASGFAIVAPYIFKFSMFSYVKNENDVLTIAEKAVDAVLRTPASSPSK